MRRCLFQTDKREEHARHAENGSGSAGSNGHRMPIHAGNAAQDAAGEIRQKIGEAADKSFRGAAQVPQAPHVEADVHDAEMHEHAGGQAPPLPVQRERTEVRAEGKGVQRCGTEWRDAAQHHAGEDKCVEDNEADGDRIGRRVSSLLDERNFPGFPGCLIARRAHGGGCIAERQLKFLSADSAASGRHGTEMVAGFEERGIICSK